MSARVFTPENRLASALSSLEAPTLSELANDAEARLARLEGAIRLYVHEKLREIAEYAAKPEEELFAECRSLANHALEVAEVASAGGLAAIGEVARGIKAMVDSLITGGVWHTDALRLHISVITVLNQQVGEGEPDDELVLSRLRNMRRALGVAE